MDFAWKLLWFIVAVSLLVTIHEFGHFWVARKLGFKVLRFSVGFGKPLWKRVGAAPDHTEFVIAALPLGGYVRMLDERDGAVPAADLPRAFASKPPWQRILVMLAGPAANILFAIAVLWGMFWYSGLSYHKPLVGDVTLESPMARAGLRSGDEFLAISGTPTRDHSDVVLGLLDAVSSDGVAAIDVRGKDGAERHLQLNLPDAEQRHRLTEPQALFSGLGFGFWRPESPARLGAVREGGPAAAAGLAAGDVIVSVNDTRVATFRALAEYINAHPAETVTLDVKRGEERFEVRATTLRAVVNGKTIGRLLIDEDYASAPPFPPEYTTHVALGPFAALGRSVSEAWSLTATQAKFFARMITGQLSIKNLSGAISIAEYAGNSASAGAESFLMFLVLISLSLGFLNLLPIPILDGGQIVFQLAEWAKGKPLSDRAYLVGQQAGLLLLFLLMGVALFNDISGIAARP